MKHHTGKWLNPVKAVNSVEPELDDNEGLRTTRKVDNVLGMTGKIILILVPRINCSKANNFVLIVLFSFVLTEPQLAVGGSQVAF